MNLRRKKSVGYHGVKGTSFGLMTAKVLRVSDTDVVIVFLADSGKIKKKRCSIVDAANWLDRLSDGGHFSTIEISDSLFERIYIG